MEGLKKEMEELVTSGEAAGIAVVIMDSGSVVFEHSCGMSGAERGMESEDKFRIASISKLVTTIGFMRLVEDGRISLDEDISPYLGFELRNPWFREVAITPAMLLSHTSSIRDRDYYTAPMPCTMRDFFCEGGRYYEDGGHYGREQEKPGEYFTYANLNFGIIAAVIEKITGKRFDVYMREEVFQRLGIEASYNVRDFGSDIGRVGVLFRKKYGVWVPQVDDYEGKLPETSWYTYAIGDDLLKKEEKEIVPGIEEYEPGDNGTLFSPHGGLRISAGDLAKIMGMLIERGVYQGKSYLRRETVELMEGILWEYEGENGDNMQGLMKAYGLSVHHLREDDVEEGLKYLAGYRGHTGEAYGMVSAMFYHPDLNRGFVYYITGSGRPLEEVTGRKSAFTSWEEGLLEKIKGIS